MLSLVVHIVTTGLQRAIDANSSEQVMTVKGKMIINGPNGRLDNKYKSRIQIGCIVNIIVHGYRCTNLFPVRLHSAGSG